MTRKKHGNNEAAVVEAAHVEAEKVLDDSGAVESATLSDVAVTNPDLPVVAETPASPPAVAAEIVPEVPAPTPPPAWVVAATMLCPRASDGNGAWHDYFKEPLPSAPKEQWSGPDAIYSYYDGGRVLVAYHFGGWFAVMTTTPPLEKKR